MNIRTDIMIEYGENGQFVWDGIDVLDIHVNVVSVKWKENGLSRQFVVPMSEVKFIMLREIAEQEEESETVHK